MAFVCCTSSVNVECQVESSSLEPELVVYASLQFCVIQSNLATNFYVRLGIGTDILELVPIVKAGSTSLHT